MKRGLLASYVDGIRDQSDGESYSTLIGYFLPEFVTALVLYSALNLLDDYWIAQLGSTSAYAAIGLTNSTLLLFVTKLAEGLSIGSVVLCGQYNGAQEFKKVGEALINTFWVAMTIGAGLAGLFYVGAPWIYAWCGFTPKMIAVGVPFLRLRITAIFFSFVYFSFVSFLRGVKNTRTPMYLFLIGAIVFVGLDYLLIFGKWGFPALGVMGSAWASIAQYGVMLTGVIWLIMRDERYKKYGIALFSQRPDWRIMRQIIALSWPVVLDKSTMALACIWLGKMIAPMGKCAMASFNVIKNMERFAFLPAVAFAQVITFVVSNNCGSGSTDVIKKNIKKVIFLASLFVLAILTVFSVWPQFFITFFDKNGVFTDFAARVFPLVSILVMFDLLQLILSGALRGARDVRMVMWTRVLVSLCCFVPGTYLLSSLPIAAGVLKFTLVYGMFHVCSGLMSIMYVSRFRKDPRYGHNHARRSTQNCLNLPS